MKINVTQPCPTCKGHKKQVQPHWWALFKRREHEPELKATEYFLELGITSSAQRPPLVIDCLTCKGAGEVPTWVPLKRFLELAHLTGQELYKLFGGAPL